MRAAQRDWTTGKQAIKQAGGSGGETADDDRDSGVGDSVAHVRERGVVLAALLLQAIH